MLIKLVVPGEMVHIEDLIISLEAVLQRHQVDSSICDDVRLIVEELACNAIEHGNSGALQKQELSVKIDIQDDLLCLQFSDTGKPFDPLTVGDPDLDADILDRPIGGLGLYLIRQLAESIEYQRIDNLNLLRVALRIPHKEKTQ